MQCSDMCVGIVIMCVCIEVIRVFLCIVVMCVCAM